MFTAIDKIGNKVWIESAIKGEEYYCSCCFQPVMQRRGSQRAHHFAHFGDRKGYSSCTDRWSYDMTEWHKSWQAQFPIENIEVVIENNGEKHRADVCIGKTVIEFQHSNISVEEFRKRNAFYTSAGYDVIWVFDVSDQCEEGQINAEYERGKYTWKKVKTPFKDVNQISDENATVYFQTSNNDTQGANIERVKKSYKNFKLFFTDYSNVICFSDFVKQANQNAQKLVKTFPKTPNNNIDIDNVDGKSIYELWKSDYSGMAVTNLITNQQMIINGKYGEIYRKNNRVIGKYSTFKNGKYEHSDYYIVKDADKPIWKLDKYFFKKTSPNDASHQQSGNTNSSETGKKQSSNNSFSNKKPNEELKNVIDKIRNYYDNPRFHFDKKEQETAQNFQQPKIEFVETGKSIVQLFMDLESKNSSEDIKVKCLPNNKVYLLKFKDGVGAHFELYEYNTTTKIVEPTNSMVEITRFFKANNKNIATSTAWELYYD